MTQGKQATQDEQPKPRKKRVTKKDRDYVDNYKAEAEKIYALSRFAATQLLGERPAGDPRLDYMAGLEAFKNLANAQLSALTHLIQELMGDDKEAHFREIQQRELARQVESMKDDLCVTGWTEEGAPIFNLPALRERTKNWPGNVEPHDQE